ncbi:MAG: hypothetical protein ACO22U_16890 [bacterium]
MKLYWRVKRNGKWTWRPARYIVQEDNEDESFIYLAVDREEEE